MKLLIDILGNIVGTWLLFFLYSTFLNNPQISKKKLFIIYFIDVIFCVFYCTITITPLQRVCCSLVYITFPLFFYKEKWRFKLIFALIYFIIFVFSELFLKALLLGYVGDFSLFYSNYTYHHFLGVLFSKILALFLIYSYSVLVKMHEKKLPIYLCGILLLIPLLSILIFYYLQTIVIAVNQQEVYNAYCFIIFVLLMFNIIIVFLFSQASQASWLKAQLEYEKKLVREQQEYHNNLASYHQRIRQLYHDINNHFLILHHSLQENDINAAKEYIETELNLLPQNKMIYTGYLLIDSIIDCKKQIAKKQNAHIIVYSELMQQPLDDEKLQDFSIMLASCIDNALEAICKIKDPEKQWIKIILKNSKTYFYCSIENPVYENIPIFNSQIPPSTKAASIFHGLGLRNVKKLAEKNGGNLSLECADKLFITKFTIKYK